MKKVISITSPEWAERTGILEVRFDNGEIEAWVPPTEEHVKILRQQAEEADKEAKEVNPVEKEYKSLRRRATNYTRLAIRIKNYLETKKDVEFPEVGTCKLSLAPCAQKPDYSEEDAKRLTFVEIDTKGLYT